MENFVIGVLGDEFRVLIECAAEPESEQKKSDIGEMLGESADELDRIAEVRYKSGQWYSVLVLLTE